MKKTTKTISDEPEFFDFINDITNLMNVSRSAIYAGAVRKVFGVTKTKNGKYIATKKPKTVIQ
jgi:hypothetical protein